MIKIFLLSVLITITIWSQTALTQVPIRLIPFKDNSSWVDTFPKFAQDSYNQINVSDLNFDAYQKALKGYLDLKQSGKLKNSDYLTIIDYSIKSAVPRLFLIDMRNNKIVSRTLVAHGRNSGELFAKKFSNDPNSFQSSLGFYVTGETYKGKHGLSLKLDGMDKSNNQARARGIVMHSADYVCTEYVKNTGRLGRSQGCPAVSSQDLLPLVCKIKDGSCIYMYYPATGK